MNWQISSEYVLSTIGLFALWCVRLEIRTTNTQKDVNRIEHVTDQEFNKIDKRIETLVIKHDALDSKIAEDLAKIRESLARIEGGLAVKKGE